MAYLRDYLKDKASCDEQGTHTVYWMPSAIFNMIPIKRWKYNRPPDDTRVQEIREWIQQSKRVDGIIYLACVGNEIVCYESNHRREALRGIDGLHNILVDMMWDATDEIVKQEFFRLNKAISVPELFVTEQPTVRLEDLMDVVNKFCENYSKMRSPNKHPHRPNFNRDQFMEDLYSIVKDSGITIEEAMNRLEKLNWKLAVKDKTKLSKTIIDKCEKTGMWLFAWKTRLNVSDLENEST